MKKGLLRLIRWYQQYVSPSLPPRCRFRPTCSQYAVEAIERFGVWRGGILAVKRFLRCHPFYKGNIYDPVPQKTGRYNQKKNRRKN
ncbi:MAG: membrane protein insertion efficiency factor YidD [Oscillospiraceae bacterium]|nr:membrane protein insertion efficiency factor YidD [Oscillospiraceae bacterium]